MTAQKRPSIVRRLYGWVLHWAGTKQAVPALGVLAFAEASFFPIPPDVLLMAMAFAIPKRSFFYAAVCSVFSVLGGMLGYYIGVALMDAVGCDLIALYNGEATFDLIAGKFTEYDFWAIFVAAVTPIPYKIFTITAGAVSTDLLTFVLASSAGRPLRFFAVASVIFFFGPPVRRFIEKYFNVISIGFVILLIGGFALLKFLGGGHGGGAQEAESPYAEVCGPSGPAPKGPDAAPDEIDRESG